MNVRLAALDVIVQVVPKGANQVDRIVTICFRGVSRKEDKGNVANVVAHAGVSFGELSWWLPVGEEYLGIKRNYKKNHTN